MPHNIRKAIVLFVGLSKDHHSVLCIREENGLSIPQIELDRGHGSASVAESLKETYIFDEARCRPTVFAYDTMSLAPRHGSAAILTHAEVIDDRCWMICPHTGIWVPWRQLVTTGPLPTRKALLALERKHHLM